MKPAPFEYHAPTTVDEAVALLAELGDEAKVLAGGQSLVPMMAFRLARAEHLVDIGRITALRGVGHEDGTLVVGAATTHATIEHDTDVHRAVPLLGLATPLIGHFQIRNRGTMGGSLAHADPAAELPAVALALDATVTVVSGRGARTIAAADVFDGLWSTTLAPDELLVEVRFARWNGRAGFAAEEYARRHGDFAIAGAMVGLALDGDGGGDGAVVARCSIALFGVGTTPVRAAAAEKAVTGTRLSLADLPEVGALAVDGLDPADDLHGSGAYRRRVAAAMVERGLEHALARAGAGKGRNA